jgi:succinyl-CoA synthetase beta subunit
MLLDGVATTTESSEPMALIRMMDEFRSRREELLLEQTNVRRFTRPATLGHQDGVVAQVETTRLLHEFGLPMLAEVLTSSVEEAVRAASSLGFPVVMKLSADWMPHRSEHGAVKLGIGSGDAVREAYGELEAIASATNAKNESFRISIESMVPSGVELIVGARRDRDFGPIITVGVGGVLVEIIREQEMVLAPVTRATGMRAVQRLAEGRLVGNVRGISVKASEKVVDTMIALGDLMTMETIISEVEINPLIVHGDDVVGVDSLLVASNG